MITKDNLKTLLVSLNFEKNGHQYHKQFTHAGVLLTVDFEHGKLIYPEDQGLKINEKQTCNFAANENFVVFECLYRLLEKGYKPQHIELEPKWKLGHGASGGRADILIKDNNGDALLIIECKTPGREFDKAWRNTQQDGDQLFSYAQQISESQFLCLYTSDFEAGEVRYQSHIIAHRDNDKYLADNPQFKNFKQATDVKERFAVWRDTYKLDYTSKGIFEDNIQPYHIGKDKYTLADLRSLSASERQKKYHEFATILRQHNVSGRENAFDKLVNLFLCKLVDETENPQELKFYWKGVAYDTHFELLDRIQQLYQAGMKEFLGEEITYIHQNDVNNALRFIRQNPDSTQRAVWNLFIQQKFFTNNDFSFIDVHNEKLFYQNAEVLLKILQMWQDIRLTGDNRHNQFLGDMFEGFLDQGIKQSEGQFFTPMPICRFILMSLPLQTLVESSPQPPKAIDYACGAGHFLNELAAQIEPFIAAKNANPADYHQAIFGIEKEYRLSKVAKVSAFMYGQQAINICYGDALVNRHAAFPDIRDNCFDLLVANPPYSVRGFLETLPEEERNAYSLSATIDKLDSNNSIEAFFIERAKQLLKAGGVAALILPSSILSNGGNTYVKTREILLQYFDIVAIAEFGSGTFGKTGTNTVTLFLRRKPTAPDTAEHYRERVNEWFTSNPPLPAGEGRGEGNPYQDADLYHRYAQHIGLKPADYRGIFNGQFSDTLLQHETFAAYRKAFDASTEIVNLQKQRSFKNKPAEEQQTELSKRFVNFVQTIERDKLYHFVLADSQPNPVLVIKSPSDNKAQKRFLGYEWSSAKGNEGIKLDKDVNGHHQTLLYDEARRDNPEKLNTYIAANFKGVLSAIPSDLNELAFKARLVDMLDFSRVTFEKQLSLTIKKAVETQSKWPLEKIGAIAETSSGGTPLSKVKEYYEDGYIPWINSGEVKQGIIYDSENKITELGLKNSSAKIFPKETVLVAMYGATAGQVGLLGIEAATNQAICGILPNKKLDHKFLFYFLLTQLDRFLSLRVGVARLNLSQELIKNFKIPLPPVDIQQQIVTECEAVDKAVSNAQTDIETAQQNIQHKIHQVLEQGYPIKALQEICEIKRGRFSHRPRNEPRFFGGEYPFIQTGDVVRAIAAKVSYTQTLNEEGLAVSKLFQPPVVLVTIAANIGDTAVLDYPACFTDSVVGLMPKEGINARFLELMMRTHKKHLNDTAPQMAQKNINIEILKPVKVPVPPIAEQEALAAKIENLEQTIAAAQAVIAAAPAQKQAIMQKYL